MPPPTFPDNHASNRRIAGERSPVISKGNLLSRMQPAKNGDGTGARDDALHLSRRRVSFSLRSLSGARPPSPFAPLARGTRRWVPPFCARIVTPSTRPLPPPSPSRGAVLQCLATPGHCYQYCYYYRYCCRLRPSGEWKSRGPVEPAATSSVALEANYTPPPSPSGPPIVAFIPPLYFPLPPLAAFPKSFDLSSRSPKLVGDIKSLLSESNGASIAFLLLHDEYINNVRLNYLQK